MAKNRGGDENGRRSVLNTLSDIIDFVIDLIEIFTG